MTIDLSDYSYYIRPGFTDMRKRPCSLAGLVSSEMGHDPYDRSVYLFCGRSRKTIKALACDGTGWLVLTKRLVVEGTFRWPQGLEECVGLDVGQRCRPAGWTASRQQRPQVVHAMGQVCRMRLETMS